MAMDLTSEQKEQVKLVFMANFELGLLKKNTRIRSKLIKMMQIFQEECMSTNHFKYKKVQ